MPFFTKTYPCIHKQSCELQPTFWHKSRVRKLWPYQWPKLKGLVTGVISPPMTVELFRPTKKAGDGAPGGSQVGSSNGRGASSW